MTDPLFTDLAIDRMGKVHPADRFCRAIGCEPFTGCRQCLGSGCHACDQAAHIGSTQQVQP